MIAVVIHRIATLSKVSAPRHSLVTLGAPTSRHPVRQATARQGVAGAQIAGTASRRADRAATGCCCSRAIGRTISALSGEIGTGLSGDSLERVRRTLQQGIPLVAFFSDDLE